MAIRQTTEPDHSCGLDLRDPVALVGTPQEPSGVLDAPAEAWLRLDESSWVLAAALSLTEHCGENCFSRIIEEIFARHPAVHQVAVAPRGRWTVFTLSSERVTIPP